MPSQGFGVGQKYLYSYSSIPYPYPILLSYSSIEFYFGKYHNLHSGQPPTLSPQQFSFDFNDYPMGDSYNPDDYATSIDEPLSQSKAEVPAQLFIIRNLTEGGSFTGTWYRDRDKKILYQFTYPIPSPQSQGYDYWNWYAIWSWIGKFPHEMNEPGHYFVTLNTTWANRTIDFDFTCPNPQISINII